MIFKKGQAFKINHEKRVASWPNGTIVYFLATDKSGNWFSTTKGWPGSKVFWPQINSLDYMDRYCETCKNINCPTLENGEI